MTTKKLYRSSQNSMIMGVCGGLGEYFDIDPTLIRLIFVFFTFITGILPLTIAYIMDIAGNIFFLTLFQLILVLFTFITGILPFIIVYIIAGIIIPKQP